ncbi:threonine/serine exporter family protein, partial [uncultured Duncaniella sp.]
MVEKIFQDALFAAIAAIGFAAISRPPRRAYVYCALIAAVGHSLRFVLMD